MIDLPPLYRQALDFEAPYLIEKLLNDHVVDTAEEAQALFQEVKRYIVLVRVASDTVWDMHSLRIDEVWHQFVLFTSEYINFSFAHFGQYINHSPSNAPAIEVAEQEPLKTSDFEAFAQRYLSIYEEPLPSVWWDERQVTINRRVINNHWQSLSAIEQDGMSHLCDAQGEKLLSVNRLAHPALHFVCQTPTFYVRELPHELTADEKVALISTLMEYRLVRTAS